MTIEISLDIHRDPTTAGQTVSYSPKQHLNPRRIRIDLGEIRSGRFGTIHQAIYTSTGDIYAVKHFTRSGEDFRES